MPTLLITTNRNIDKAQQMTLLRQSSKHLAVALDKPERYVMASIESGKAMLFAASDAPCAYLELKSLDLPEEETAALSHSLCELIGTALTIPEERIYIEFSSPAPHMWGWNSTTF
jgi:phenylpyruvate tautomerase